MSDNFWQFKSLQQMTEQEWESLCDGCARCCLMKLEDEDTAEVHYTNVSCRLLNTETCQCVDYPHRLSEVPECLDIRKMKQSEYQWLPASCAYRRLSEGKPLAEWHPLISGRQVTVKEAGLSVAGFAISEEYVHTEQLEQHIFELPDIEDAG